MITEDRLRAALEEAGATFEPPADGPQRIIAAAVEPPAPGRQRPTMPRRRLVLAAGLVAGAMVIGVVATGSDSERAPTYADASRDELDQVKEQMGEAAPGGPVVDNAARPASAAPNAAAGTATNNSSGSVALTKIVKQGAIELEVADGRVETALSRLQIIAAGASGMVSDSKSSEANNDPSGVVTLRIPADQFDAVSTQVRRLGKVRNASSSAADVTAEYTDITARLKSLTATRESLLQVLAGARSIGDILAVRDRITDNQTQIEQLQGRQQVLDNQVALSSLVVSVNEPGVATSETSRRSAWSRAVDGFTATWSSILAHAGGVIAVLIALSLLAAAVYFSGNWVRRAYIRRRA